MAGAHEGCGAPRESEAGGHIAAPMMASDEPADDRAQRREGMGTGHMFLGASHQNWSREASLPLAAEPTVVAGLAASRPHSPGTGVPQARRQLLEPFSMLTEGDVLQVFLG